MLYLFGFDRLAMVAGDLYFQHPDPPQRQEGPECGVRLELRHLTADELKGTMYSARPISVGEPIWRIDLLESVAGPSGSFDRTHHHPRFAGWDESERVFEEELSVDPFGWLERTLADLPGVLSRAGAPASTASPADLDGLRSAVPEILDVTRRLLARVRAGDLRRPPGRPDTGLIREGWL